MSTLNPNDYDYRTAALQGLGNMHGGDPEVLQDLGIPVDGDDVEKHVASGERVRDLTPVAAAMGHTLSEHDKWVDSLHLTHPSSQGPVTRATPRQREATTEHVQAMKAHIVPMGQTPGNPEIHV